MKIIFFQIQSFTEYGTNPRLPYYAEYLEENKVQNEYQFLGSEKSGWIAKSFNSFLLAFQLFGKKKEVDLLYFYAPNILFLPIYIAAKVLNINIIVEKTELDSARPDSKIKDQLVKFSYRLDEILFPYFADGLVVISDKLKKHYQNKIEDIHLCSAFTDTQRFYLDEKPDETPLLRIGYLGTFGSKDNVPGIIAAFLIAKKQIKGLKLKLMGKSNQEANPDKHADISVQGAIPFEQIPLELNDCDLLISNRLDTKYSNYGSPTKLVEYLATGKAVIASRIDSKFEFLKDQDNIVFCQANDELDLAQKIIERYSDYSKYTNIGKKGQIACRKYLDKGLILPPWYEFIIQNKN